MMPWQTIIPTIQTIPLFLALRFKLNIRIKYSIIRNFPNSGEDEKMLYSVTFDLLAAEVINDTHSLFWHNKIIKQGWEKNRKSFQSGERYFSEHRVFPKSTGWLLNVSTSSFVQFMRIVYWFSEFFNLQNVKQELLCSKKRRMRTF